MKLNLSPLQRADMIALAAGRKALTYLMNTAYEDVNRNTVRGQNAKALYAWLVKKRAAR